MIPGDDAATVRTRRAPLGLALDVLAAEWIKLRSLRSTFWALLVAAVTAVGGSAVVALATSRAGHSPFGPVEALYVPWLEYPVLAVGILGVLTFTSEYSTGQMRTTLAAVPQRGILLLAKVASLGGLMLCVGEALAFTSFFVGAAIAAGHGGLSLSQPGIARAVVLAGFDLFAIAVVGIGLGAIVRHTAGAVVALPGVVYLPLALLSLPVPWGDRVGRFSLLAAAYQTVSLHPKAGLLSPSCSVLVVAAWPAVVLVIATVLFARRDA